MHPHVAHAIQEIDAALFNGDTFDDPDMRDELLEYIARWTRQLMPAAVRDRVSQVLHDHAAGTFDQTKIDLLIAAIRAG